MSGIYIKGMEMPKRGHTVTLTIMGGGEVAVQYYDCKPQLTVPILYKAVPVPEHGRLIDADALMKHKGDCYDSDGHLLYAVGTGTIMRMPAIIPAEPADKGEQT